MRKLAATVILVLSFSGNVWAAEEEVPLPLSSPEVYDEVADMVREFGARMTNFKGPQPDKIFDANDPAPMYLAEEMPDWFIGWEKFEWYFNTPERFAMIEAMDYNPSNIRVRSLSDDLALATWFVWAEFKFARRPPVGEHLRATGILRKTAEGWRFIYYAESPKSTMQYINDMYEVMASPEFRKRFDMEPKKEEFMIE